MELKNIDKIKKVVDKAKHIIITSGAGMSADSGLTTFRDKDKFYNRYPILEKLGLTYQEVVSGIMFNQKPKFVWAFYADRHRQYVETEPHDGYYDLLKLCRTKQSYFSITSNVDGHFIKAGYDSKNVHEIHGSIHYMQCNCTEEITRLTHILEMKNNEVVEIPRCKYCGYYMRPNILMFNDYWFNSEREQMQRERCIEALSKIGKDKAVVIEIGAGTVVPTIRKISEKLVRNNGNYHLIRMNLYDTEIPNSIKDRSFVMQCNAIDGIKALLD